MILPLPRDPQVLRRQADPLEAIGREDALGCRVVQQRGCLQPMQRELDLCAPDHLGDGAAHQPTADERRIDPVPEISAVEGTAHDVRDVRHSEDPAVVLSEDEPRGATVRIDHTKAGSRPDQSTRLEVRLTT